MAGLDYENEELDEERRDVFGDATLQKIDSKDDHQIDHLVFGANDYLDYLDGVGRLGEQYVSEDDIKRAKNILRPAWAPWRPPPQ